MKKEEVPQDGGIFTNTVFNDINYALDADGNYVAVDSKGWNVKTQALEVNWDAVADDCRRVREQVLAHETSALAYHMCKQMQDVSTLSANSGISKHQIKKDLDYAAFAAEEDDVLNRLADALRITPEEIRSVPDK